MKHREATYLSLLEVGSGASVCTCLNTFREHGSIFSYERDLTTAFTCLLCINHMILKEWFDSPRYLAQFLRFLVFRSIASSNSWICHLQKFCVGEAPRSYVPAPAGGWKWGKCLQMSKHFPEAWEHI